MKPQVVQSPRKTPSYRNLLASGLDLTRLAINHERLVATQNFDKSLTKCFVAVVDRDQHPSLYIITLMVMVSGEPGPPHGLEMRSGA